MVVTTRRKQAQQQSVVQNPLQAARKQPTTRVTRANSRRQQTQPVDSPPAGSPAEPSLRPSHASAASPKSVGSARSHGPPANPSPRPSQVSAVSKRSVGDAGPLVETSARRSYAEVVASPKSVGSGSVGTHGPAARPSPRQSYVDAVASPKSIGSAGTHDILSPASEQPSQSRAIAKEPPAASSHESPVTLFEQISRLQDSVPLQRTNSAKSWRSFATISSKDDIDDDGGSLTSPTEDPTELSEPNQIAETTLASEMRLLDLDDGFRVDASNTERTLYEPVSVFFPTTDTAGCRFGQIDNAFVVADVPAGCQLDVQPNDQIMAINGIDATGLSLEEFKAEWNRNRNGQRLVTLGRKIEARAAQGMAGAGGRAGRGLSGRAGRGLSGRAGRGLSGSAGRGRRAGRNGRAVGQRGRQEGRGAADNRSRGRNTRVTSRLDAEDNANALAEAEAAREKGKYQRQLRATFSRRFGDLRGTKAEKERLKLLKNVMEYGKMVTPDPSIEGAENWVRIVPALLLVDPFMPPNEKGGRRSYGVSQTREERIALAAFSNGQLDLAKTYLKALVDSNFGEGESDFRICIGTDPTALWEFFRKTDEPLEENEPDGSNGEEEEVQQQAAAAPEDDFVSMFNTPARTG